MAVARLKVGLPAKRYQGKVKISPQGTVDEVVKEHEQNLDDAFRIQGATAPASNNSRVPANEEKMESKETEVGTEEVSPSQATAPKEESPATSEVKQ